MDSSFSDDLDVRAAAEQLVGPLREFAALAESQRRVPDESLRLLRASGLLTLLQPASCGGRQMTMRAHLDAVSTIAKGCNAAAWVLGVYHAHSWMMGHMGRQAQLDVYGESSDAPIAAVIGPRGKAVRQRDGGYILSGFWPFCSGNAAARWLLLGAEIFDEAGAKLDEGDLLVPTEQVERLDDWRVAGLQGTGSNSVRCEGLTVPAHRYLSLSALLENHTPPYADPAAPALYKAQAGPVLGLCIASAAPGMARGAIEEFVRVVPGKRVNYTDHLSHDWTPVQAALGEASGEVHAAELLLERIADDIDDHARRAQKMSMRLRARIRFELALAVRLCHAAVERLYTIGGAAGLQLASPIQRAARNLQAVNMHGLLLYESGAEIFGRVELGLDPGTTVI